MNNNKSEIPDSLNVDYLFSTVETSLLSKILQDRIDLTKCLKKELANRGVDENGLWVGFEAASKLHLTEKG